MCASQRIPAFVLVHGVCFVGRNKSAAKLGEGEVDGQREGGYAFFLDLFFCSTSCFFIFLEKEVLQLA